MFLCSQDILLQGNIFGEGPVNSAEDLAERLQTSLDAGLTTNARELGRRARTFGTNSLPERDQVLPRATVKQLYQSLTVEESNVQDVGLRARITRTSCPLKLAFRL